MAARIDDHAPPGLLGPIETAISMRAEHGSTAAALDALGLNSDEVSFLIDGAVPLAFEDPDQADLSRGLMAVLLLGVLVERGRRGSAQA